MKLGIAGVPDDRCAIIDICKRLDVQPIFVLGPEDELPDGGEEEHVLRVSAWDLDGCLDPIRCARLNGLWAASGKVRLAVAAVASHLGFPHLPCTDVARQAALPIAGALVVELAAMERWSETDRRRVPLPAWVRSACGNGDASCMRVDHLNELRLASDKLRNRNAHGPIRVQPAIDGAVYRLMSFKNGRDLVPFDIASEETTASQYRVPIGFAMPVPRRGALLQRVLSSAREVNRSLPWGWGYVEMEFVDTGEGVCLVDLQCPARLDPHLRGLVLKSQGVDLLQAELQCALGHVPSLSPTRDTGVALSWLLTHTGVVTGIQGVKEAQALPGVDTVHIAVSEGDILSHVVDIPTRERGGYIVATGGTAAIAQTRLEAARERVCITTSPALA